MIERVGDLWNYHSEGKWVVVTTNIGWKKNGSNPMGAGLARTAAEKYPELPGWYGHRCKKYGEDTAVCYFESGRLILFPTKPLNEEQPWLSWQQDADLALIKRSTIQLQKLGEILQDKGTVFGNIGVPLVGCLNGNLGPRQFLPILRHYLDDRFILLEHS